MARTGKPRLPNTSQNTTGFARHAGSAMPVAFSRSFSFGDVAPAAAMPDRSPLTSARNTGTPMLREMLGQHLQRDGLAGAGRAGDQPVAIGQRRTEHARPSPAAVFRDRRIGSAMRFTPVAS